MTHHTTNLIKDDKVAALEFSMLAFNNKKQVMFSNIFFIPSEALQKKIYNMLFLMLDPKLKSHKICNKIFEHCYPSCENHLQYQIYIIF